MSEVFLYATEFEGTEFSGNIIRHSAAVYKYPGMKIFCGIIEFRRKYCFDGKNYSRNYCKFGEKNV